MLGKTVRRMFADASALHPLFAAIEPATQKRAGTQDHRRRHQGRAVGKIDPGNAPTIEPQRSRLSGDDGQIILPRHHGLNRRAKALAVGLHTRPLHRAAFRTVEHPVMDRTRIGRARNHPVKGIDLADEMALAQTTDRRITTHGADRCRIERDERGARAHACGNRRRLDAGMPAANHDDIELVHGARVNGFAPGGQKGARCFT